MELSLFETVVIAVVIIGASIVSAPIIANIVNQFGLVNSNSDEENGLTLEDEPQIMDIIEIRFCEQPNEEGHCDDSSPTFDGPARIYATIVYSNGIIDEDFKFNWIQSGRIIAGDVGIIEEETGAKTYSYARLGNKLIDPGSYIFKVLDYKDRVIRSQQFLVQ